MRPQRVPALFTDLYELTMAASYFDRRMFAPATFSLFVREYPPDRAYFVSAGIEEVVRFLEGLRFTKSELAYLRRDGRFTPAFLDYLAGLRFTGEIRAVPEGRLFFVNEPVLEITAPIIEAQLVETFVINAMSLQTMLATKASRAYWAAGGRQLVDFSLRRTQGTDAGMKVARVCYITGFDATSNVLAGQLYGIPTAGTMAHSYIEAFEREIDAFRAFVETYPETTLLIDTYDTVQGARKAVEVARALRQRGLRLHAVRLDSGDMARLSREVRRVLDEAGLTDVGIFASGAFDEFKIQRLIGEGARIDGFGVGTKMGVSADAPWLDIAYKLVRYDGRPVMKLSTGKATLVGGKQVFRVRSPDGALQRDLITLREEEPPRPDESGDLAEPLLETVMERGRALRPRPSLPEVRKRFLEEFGRLHPRHKAIVAPEPYPVETSSQLQALQAQVTQEVRRRELGEG